MIQDIAPHTFNNEYTPSAPKGSDYVIVVDDRKILLKEHADGRLMLPTVSDLLRDSGLLSLPAASASEAAAAPSSVPTALLHLPLRPPQPPLLSQQTNLLLTKQLRMLFHYL